MKRTTKKDGADKKHLDFIRSLVCLNCATSQNIEAHHLLNVPENELKKDDLPFGKSFCRGVGSKLPDRWTIPLCSRCHKEVHSYGSDNFLAFYDTVGVSKLLYELSGDYGRASYILKDMIRGRRLNLQAYYECLE